MNEKRARQVLRCTGPWHEEAHGPVEAEAMETAKSLPELAAEYENQVKFDRTASPAVEIALPEDFAAVIAGYGEKFSAKKSARRFSLRDPAMIAVLAAFVVLLGLVAWIYLANEGGFAGMREVKNLVQVGNSATAMQYDPMEARAEVLGDWFVLEGFDGFAVPDEFRDFAVVGVRLFQYEGTDVAAVAVPLDGRRAFFYSFDAHSLGVAIEPEGEWKLVMAGANDELVIAAREIGSGCFVVTFRGTKEEMMSFLRDTGSLRE